LNEGAAPRRFRLSVLRISTDVGSRRRRGFVDRRTVARWRAAPLTRLIVAAGLAIATGSLAVAQELAADGDRRSSLDRTPLVPQVRGPLLAPRDGVLGIPVSIRAADAADAPLLTPGTAAYLEGLPDEATVVLEDGRRLAGLVAVLAPPTVADLRSLREAAWPRGWTRRAGAGDVLSPTEARRLGRPGAALLLVRTPPDAAGPIRLGDRSIDVRWRPWDAPYTGLPLPGADQPRLAREARPDRPDPEDPLSWWRWVLLADELGWRPPPPPGADERTRRVAEHLAARWRIALGRLGAAHPGVASTLRDALTVRLDASAVTADDDPLARPIGPPPPELPAAIAGWRTDPDDLERVVSRLLDVDRPISRLASEVVAWSDALEPILAWPEAPDPGVTESVVLHLGNRTTAPSTVRLSWTSTLEGAREVVLPPRSLCRIELRRPLGGTEAGTQETPAADDDRSRGTASPPGTSAAAARTRPDVLQVIDRRSRSRRIAWAPLPIVVRPPGLDLAPAPRLTLAAVERGAIDDAAAMGGLAMNARVRRRAGRWEVFVECRRPPGTEDDAVELWLGPVDGGRILHVPESGPTRWLIGGAGNAADSGAPDPSPVVSRRSWADRWYARIVIPPAWIGDGRLDLALRRMVDGSPGGDVTAPGPVPAWGADPGRLRLDLRRWDD